MPRDCTGRGYLVEMISPCMFRDPILTFTYNLMARNKRSVKQVVAKEAKSSTSYTDYLKRLALLVAGGFAGAALQQYRSKSTYNVLRHSPGGIPMRDMSAFSMGSRGVSSSSSMPYSYGGTGDYYGIGKGISSGLGGMVGTAIGAGGGPFGAMAGGTIGSGLGEMTGEAIFGAGDYEVARNTLATKSFAIPPGQLVPQFGGLTSYATRVRHREYVRDLVVPATPSAFTNVSTVINPGNGSLFPWLAVTAGQYQQYEIHGMVVEFRPLSSDVAAGGALGSVIIATNYDVLEGPFPDKVRMENAQFTVSTKPSCGLIHTIECDPSQRPTKLLYVRDSTSSGTASQDARFMDLGTLQIATAGLPSAAGTVLGELWISYDISFYKPEIASVLGSSQLWNGFVGSIVALPYGTASTSSNSAFTVLNNSISSMTFLSTGTFIVEFAYSHTLLTAFTLSPTTGVVVVTLTADSVDNATNGVRSVLHTVSSPGASISLTVTAGVFAMTLVRVFKIA